MISAITPFRGRAASNMLCTRAAGLGGAIQMPFAPPIWTIPMRLNSSDESYEEQKSAKKQKRRDAWERKESRLASLKTRRAGRPMMGQKRKAFQTWFDPLRQKQLFQDRKARRDGLSWKVKVAAIIERQPLVTWDKPKWLKDYEELETYLQFFGKEFPKELEWTKFPTEFDRPNVTEEELIGELRCSVSGH
mmetsp:Transcript_13161/g.38759  ORF Transcript_13161/g.38759 Transcript_13161/m.38759 type:complete len:191 (+) Transcript_13161:163-735(+)